MIGDFSCTLCGYFLLFFYYQKLQHIIPIVARGGLLQLVWQQQDLANEEGNKLLTQFGNLRCNKRELHQIFFHPAFLVQNICVLNLNLNPG
jgi:hypothetical protein